jgi:hypothetical protein
MFLLLLRLKNLKNEEYFTQMNAEKYQRKSAEQNLRKSARKKEKIHRTQMGADEIRR